MATRTPKRPGQRAAGKSARTSSGSCPAMFHGTPSAQHLLALWEESHRDDPLESRAAALLRRLEAGETPQDMAGELQDLQEQGSKLATYAVATGKGAGVPADPEGARALLHQLCDQGFPAAFVELLKEVTFREPNGQEQRIPCSDGILDLVTRGAALGVERCLVLFATAWRKGWVVPEAAEGQALAGRLLEAARSGSWEALDALLQLHESLPAGTLNGLDAALDLLRNAANAGWPEAMYVLGAAYLHARLLLPDLDLAKKWLRKAWLAGSPAAGSLYAEILIAGRPPQSALKQARTILEKCCSLNHPRAMVSMSDLVMREAGYSYTRESVEYMQKAVEMGLAEPYVRYLWHHLMQEYARGGKAAKSTFLRDLSAPLLAGTPEARHRLALFTLMSANRKPALRAEAMARLEECANEWYGPSAAALAEIFLFGLYGQKADAPKGQFWLERAYAQHDPRAVSLKVLLAIEAGQKLAPRKRLQLAESSNGLLAWAAQREDALAAALSGCLSVGMADRGVHDLLQKSGRMPFLLRDSRDLLLHAFGEATNRGDLMPLIFLAQQFTRAWRLGLHDELAEAFYPFAFGDGQACAIVATILAQTVRKYDEAQGYRLEKALRN